MLCCAVRSAGGDTPPVVSCSAAFAWGVCVPFFCFLGVSMVGGPWFLAFTSSHGPKIALPSLLVWPQVFNIGITYSRDGGEPVRGKYQRSFPEFVKFHAEVGELLRLCPLVDVVGACRPLSATFCATWGVLQPALGLPGPRH
jgi:hypothetical protein